MSRPRLLDLFAGAGGAARGYQQAGFHVTGVDINPQPNYCGDEFWQCDVVLFDFCRMGFDAVHASPPCQHASQMTTCRPGLAETYPDLIPFVRHYLERMRLPYVIENVPGSSVRPDITLCGQMFGLDLYRHRLFESNRPLTQPDHPEHATPASKAGHWKPGTVMSVAGHISPIAKAREVMGIDWMTRDELSEAIPPAYTFHVGTQLREVLL